MRNTRTILKVLKWVWIFLILPFAWISIQVIEQLQRKGFPQNLYDTTLGFLFLPGWPIILTCSMLALLLLATIVVGIMAFRSKQDETPASATTGPVTTNVARSSRGSASQIGDNAVIIQNSPGAVYNPPPQITHMKQAAEQQKTLLYRYLKSVIARSENVNPTGIHQPSPAMLSISVPLQDIFIHIRAISDRPQFNILLEEKELEQEIERLRQRTDLEERTQEDYIQRLRAALSRHRDVEMVAKSSTKDITIETVLQELTSAKSVAVMLGGPGSGKSTTMRWLALHMARALCDPGYQLPDGLPAAQLPILITIGDYARTITATSSTSQPVSSIKDYLWAELKKFDGALSAIIEERLAAGRCLLLFDGLDEVASDDLRRRVMQDLFNFITSYLTGQQNAQDFNRALVTSRIVGYEPGSFADFAQYTLLDLDDEQIQQFLDSWCPAAERYRVRSGQGMKEALTEQQEQEARRIGSQQRAQLLYALQQNPGIRRLAVNPLMLTILALIQKSNRTLPHRRIELYETVTQTLLDNWNQLKGGKMLSPEEIDLAEDMLSEFAFRLHTTDLPLVKEDVHGAARAIMAEFYQRSVDEIAPRTVEHFIDTLQSSSSLFVERGQGLFGFVHRTFQEYYVMLYLMDKKHYPTPEVLITFAQERCHTAIWHEPLLLLIAYKSERRDRDEQQQATTLIQTILATYDEFDPYLHRNLLLAASAIVDCKAWIIDKPLQRDVANQLLDIYSDTYGAGRYTELQKDIEKITLLWLRGQPASSSQQPPLLEALSTALCDHTDAQRQLGAAKLIAVLAPDLSTCPETVLHTFIPPLLHLAGVQDWYRQELTCPPEIAARLFSISVHALTPDVQDYALATLRLLDTAGPAGWLRADWLHWSQQEPELLLRLAHHSLEIDYLLTPAAFPAKPDDPNWEKLLEMSYTWKLRAQRSTEALEMGLLQVCSAGRYPQGLIFKRLLSAEQAEPSTAWQMVWERILQQEMSQGHSATYQASFLLRLLLAWKNSERQQSLATKLLSALTLRTTQISALNIVTNIYLLDLFSKSTSVLKDLHALRDHFDIHALRYLLDLRDRRDLRALSDLRALTYLLDLRPLRDSSGAGHLTYLRYLQDLSDHLQKEKVVELLCDFLMQGDCPSITHVLFALYYALANYQTIPLRLSSRVERAFGVFTPQTPSLPSEQSDLVSAILGLLHPQSPLMPNQDSLITADQRATRLKNLREQQPILSKSDVDEILAACLDFRELSGEMRETAFLDESLGLFASGPVSAIALNLLVQSWGMDRAAQRAVVQALEENETVICAAAAFLLQRGKDLAPETKQAASASITRILADEELSRRSLEPSRYSIYKIWRLDDVLFETLKALAER